MMLEKYREDQKVIYNLLSNSIKNNKLSHAYLFDTNNNSNAYDIILSFVKDIFCVNKNSFEKENICKRIDNNNFLELKIINPEGLVIKKEQLANLQEEYSMSSIEADKRIYIINDCDLMNLQASNSILKFLEEPVCNVIAILVTNNINNVLKTIISRCQVITLKKDKQKYLKDSFLNVMTILSNNNLLEYNDEELNKKRKMFDNVISFINFLENDSNDVYVNIKKLWSDIYKDRIDNIYAVNVMLYFYYDVFKYKVMGQANVFCEYLDLIRKISNNEVDDIVSCLRNLLEVKSMLFSNVNINLAIDYMVISFGRR